MRMFGAALLVFYLAFATSSWAQEKPPRTIERRTRGTIDKYLRCRTNCLSRCEAAGGCGMKGCVVRQIDRGRRGIDYIFVQHKDCRGTGRQFMPKATRDLLGAFAPDSRARPYETADDVERIHAAAHRTVRNWNTKNDRAIKAEVHRLWTTGALVDLKNRLKLIERPSAVRIDRPGGIKYSRSNEGAWFVDVRLTDGEFVLFALRPREVLLDADQVTSKASAKPFRDWEWLIIDDSERMRWEKRFARIRQSVEARATAARQAVEREASRRVDAAWDRLLAMRTSEPLPAEFGEKEYARLLSLYDRELRWFDTPELAAVTLVEDVREEIRFRRKEQECIDPLSHPEIQLAEYSKLLAAGRFKKKAGALLLERAITDCRERIAVIEQVERDAGAVIDQVDDAPCGLLREILAGFVFREPFSLDSVVVAKTEEVVEQKFRELVDLGKRGSSDEDRAAALISVGDFSETAAFVSRARHVRDETRERLAFVREGAMRTSKPPSDVRSAVLTLVARHQLDAAAKLASTEAQRALVDLRSGAVETARKRLSKSLGDSASWPAEESWIDHLDALAGLWEVELRANRHASASEYLARIDELAPTWPAVQLRVAETLAGFARYDEARERLELMTSRYPGVTAGLLLDIQTRLAENDVPVALSRLRDHPELPGSELWRAVVAVRRGTASLALDHIERYVSMSPTDPLGHAHAAVIHVLNDDVEAARLACDRALKEDARCYLALLQRAEISELDEARRDLDVAQSVIDFAFVPIATRASLLPARHASSLYGNNLVAVVHVVRAAVYILVARQPTKGLKALAQAALATDVGRQFVVDLIDGVRAEFEPGSPLADLAEEVRSTFAP